MENPATWGHAERVVNEVIRDHRRNTERPPMERTIGLSLTRQIIDALRREGLLVEESMQNE